MNRLISTAFAAVVGLAGTAAAQEQLAISAGGTGGVYFPVAGGIAEVITRHVEGYSAIAVVTGATVENLTHIDNRDADFALGIADVLTQAINGTGAFDGRPVPVRAVASIYAAPMQIVAMADSDIHTLQDIRGTRFSVGAPGSGNEVNTRSVLAANGITFDDLGAVERLNYNETADGMRDGHIAAGLWAATAPTSSIMSLAASRDLRLIGLSDDEVAAIMAHDAAFVPFTLPADLYPGMDAPVQTVALANAMVTHADMDEELVYQVTRAMHENFEFLVSVHPSMADMTPEFAVSTLPIPLHPGALRFYEEAGVDVPDHLRP
ncbi:MAG: TAXI family TRAP transporter solute-binding subunit [Alkalilacustris sp.]